MTVVAGINTSQFAIIGADSRVTTVWPERLCTHVDCCQKVFRIGDATIAGFCGDVVAIAEILTTFSLLYQDSPKSMAIERHKECLDRALRLASENFYERTGERYEVGVMVAGRGEQGQFEMLQCQSPRFNLSRVSVNQFAAMGSGAPIYEMVAADIAKHVPNIVDFCPETAPEGLAFLLGVRLERTMPEERIDSVGRVLHVVCVGKADVTRVPYEIRSLIALGEHSVETEVVVGTRWGKSGEWIQYAGDGTQIVLVNPMDVLAERDLLRNERTLSVKW